MRFGQLIRLSSLFNGKSSRSITTLQILETIDRNSRSSRSELQETRFLLGIPATNTFPEILNHFIVFSVAAVISVFLPVVDVNVSDTTNKEFEFALVKDIDEVGRDEFVEASDKGLELLFDSFLNPPLSDEPRMISYWFRLYDNILLTRHILPCSHSSPQCSRLLVSTRC